MSHAVMGIAVEHRVRLASPARGDIDVILQAHDEAVVFLTRKGSDQWGEVPFSQRPAVVQRLAELVRRSEEWSRIHTGQDSARRAPEHPGGADRPAGDGGRDNNDVAPATAGRDAPSGNWAGAFIAEAAVLDDGSHLATTPCGAVILTEDFPPHIVGPRANAHLAQLVKASDDANDWLYLDHLVTRRLASRDGRNSTAGIGALLLDHAKQVTRDRGKTYLYCDCFCGPPHGLLE